MSSWTTLEILAYTALLIVAARWVIALFNLVTGTPKAADQPVIPGELSVLVPARNEAETLPILLKSLQKSGPSVGEIIIYNDQSEDDTLAIAKQWASDDHRIRILEGSELPGGWIGKNHACHQLAREASGKYLLFLDADVKTDQYAIELALSRIKKDHLTLFSFFPAQQMYTTGEWLLVAQVNVILSSLLPLSLITHIPLPVLAVANGQFMMFDANIYHQYQFHERLKSVAVEDVAIARLVKKEKLRSRAALGTRGITCRMYRGYGEALNGLARSLRFFFGGSIIAGWIYLAFSLFGWLPVIMTLHWSWITAYFLMLITTRIFIGLASHQSIFKNIVLMPFQQIALFHMFLTATKQLITGKTTWKGRNI